MNTSYPTLELDDLIAIGHDLDRPECVLALSSGELLSADWRGGVARTGLDGLSTLVAAHGDLPAGGLLPNGIALTEEGAMLIAHLGDHDGGVWSMAAHGAARPWLLEIDGTALPPTNFVHADDAGRVWVTVSTRSSPRQIGWSSDVADGFVAVVADGRARIVADGLGYTNEAKVDPSGNWLYVNETFARRVSRFAITGRADLGPRETYTEFAEGGVYPDGLEFDAEGGLWITSIFSNRVILVDRDRRNHTVLEDFDPGFLADIEEAYTSGALTSRGPIKVPGKRLRNVSSLAFGAPDLRTAFIGCLQGSRIETFRCFVAGAEPAYWHRRWV